LCKSLRCSYPTDGTYRTGMNMEDPTGNEDADDGKQPARKKRKTLNDATCKFCGQKGHMMTCSKQCLHHNGTQQPNEIPVAATAQLGDAFTLDDNDDAENLDAYKTMHQQMLLHKAQEQDVSDDEEEFRDCNTWDSDDEEQVPNVI
jgi:hypothetical protein